MAEGMRTSWKPVGAWDDCATLGRFGRMQGPAGVVIRPLTSQRMATLIVADGRVDALEATLRARFGLKLPAVGRVTTASAAQLLWTAPAQYLLVWPNARPLVDLSCALEGLAAVTDQSDSRGLLTIGGREARAALAKGIAVDLHPETFAVGSVASTSLAHVSVQLWLKEAAPVFALSVPRSFAGSVWSWLVSACAEYGCEVITDGTDR